MSTTTIASEVCAPFATRGELSARVAGLSPEARVEFLRESIASFYEKSFYRAGLDSGKAKVREVISGEPSRTALIAALGYDVQGDGEEVMAIAQRAKAVLMGAELALYGTSESCSDTEAFLVGTALQGGIDLTIESANDATEATAKMMKGVVDTKESLTAWERDVYERGCRATFLGRCHGGLYPALKFIAKLEAKSELSENDKPRLEAAKESVKIIQKLLDEGYQASRSTEA